MTTTTDAPAATRREWIGLAVLAFPTLLLSIDMSVLYLALPSLTEQLHPTSTQQLWIMDSYGFMVAGFLVTMGTLGDRIGRRRLLLIGSAGFAAASVLAAYSSTIIGTDSRNTEPHQKCCSITPAVSGPTTMPPMKQLIQIAMAVPR